METEEPLILDRYRPLETLGSGGSGTVELCWDTRIQRRVAIKRMPLSTQGADGAIPGLAEARTGAMLNHPNIVNVIDFETTEDEALLIMEAIEGPTLAQIIDETPAGEFDLDIATAIAGAIGGALDFAHENQVLHLDIKPENILVTRGGVAKVSDFGISELADVQGFGEASGGTVGYMPPEQMRGLDLDQRCDEFSFAVVVYEMLTGRNPFMAPTMEASLRLVEEGAPIPPSEFRGDLSPELDAVLLTALSPAREERFETVYDFTRALSGLMGDATEGQLKLKALVQPDDETAEERPRRRAPHGDLWQRVPRKASIVLGRILAAALSWWIAALGIAATGAVGWPAASYIALAAAIAAAAKPALGAFLALCALGVGNCYDPWLPTPLGVMFIAIAAIWPLVCRRQRAADVNCAFFPTLLHNSIFDLAPTLLSGFFLPPGRAAMASAVGAFLALSLNIMGGVDTTVLGVVGALASAGWTPPTESTLIIDFFRRLITAPSTWIEIAGYAFSAFLVSVFCSRQTRLSSIIGGLAGAAILIFTRVLVTWSQTGMWGAPDIAWTAGVLSALLIMLVICALGAPRRDEGEN